jgi:hypothetical protein
VLYQTFTWGKTTEFILHVTLSYFIEPLKKPGELWDQIKLALLHQYSKTLDAQALSRSIANEKPLIYKASTILVQQSR